eukprot:TRINITY_DN7970_c0_g1_i1.p1 TRINITY_DN7970_c0_g1~~TRINITY_DN7970_c0_g1_i1.p1  ORF type:complete len:259 (+),score=45.25 TRINITY_DN7970_c0_g1_i1:111-887(+)
MMRLTLLFVSLTLALASPSSMRAKLRRQCKWLAKVTRSRQGKFVDQPVPSKLAAMCAKINTADAYKQKEAIETRCVWLEKMKEAGQISFLIQQPWYQELSDVCEGVPKSEQADNHAEAENQQCMWIALAEASGKLEQMLERQPIYRAIKMRCDASPDIIALRGNAAGIVNKMTDAVSMLQNEFHAATDVTENRFHAATTLREPAPALDAPEAPAAVLALDAREAPAAVPAQALGYGQLAQLPDTPFPGYPKHSHAIQV